MNTGAPRARMLVAGTISPDAIMVTAPSAHDPRQTVELRITALPTKQGLPRWLTEIRVDLRLTQHAILDGLDARRQARAWLQQAAAWLLAPVERPTDIAALCAESERLVMACREARERLAVAFGDGAPAQDVPATVATVAPVEVVPAAWEEARVAEAQRFGLGIWKFFHATQA